MKRIAAVHLGVSTALGKMANIFERLNHKLVTAGLVAHGVAFTGDLGGCEVYRVCSLLPDLANRC